MAIVTRFVSDALDIMTRALSRRNANDPDSSPSIMLKYLNDFVTLTMSNDVGLFEQYSTLTFTIDGTNPTGVYTLNELGADTDFVNLSMECFISILDPEGRSVSWNYLPIFQDAGQFFSIWGINNEDILVKGYPTNLLFYGNELTFRTIPQEDESYQVRIYGYKMNNEYPSPDVPLQYAYWLRYLAYGAAFNYAQDYNFAQTVLTSIKKSYNRERKLLLTRTHNQIKHGRCLPQI